jgi:hypothetical protein
MKRTTRGGDPMEYVRIFAGADGHSQLEDVAVPAAPGGRGGSAVADPIPLGGMVFARLAAGFVREPHVAPRRQFVVTLAGAGEITTSRGRTRRLEVGTVLLAEDTTGHGHTTRTVGPHDWHVLWLPLAGESYAPPAGAAGAAISGVATGGYVRITATADGGSALEDVMVRPEAGSGDLQASALIPVTSVIFRRSPATYDVDWHNAPRRQFVVNLTGAVEIVVSDGHARGFGPGSIVCAEDLTGKGHISRNPGAGERLSLFIPLAE